MLGRGETEGGLSGGVDFNLPKRESKWREADDVCGALTPFAAAAAHSSGHRERAGQRHSRRQQQRAGTHVMMMTIEDGVIGKPPGLKTAGNRASTKIHNNYYFC